MTSKAQMGRPTIFTDDLAAAFCERIANGRSLRDVCSDEDMPSTTTINAWCKDYPDFSAQYDRAKKDRAEFHFEEMFVIADTVPAEAAEVAKARLQIDTRKWALARMDKDRYGDKTQIDNTSSDGSMSPNLKIEFINASNASNTGIGQV